MASFAADCSIRPQSDNLLARLRLQECGRGFRSKPPVFPTAPHLPSNRHHTRNTRKHHTHKLPIRLLVDLHHNGVSCDMRTLRLYSGQTSLAWWVALGLFPLALLLAVYKRLGVSRPHVGKILV